MRLSAIDALRHGLLNLRANWQLILVQALQSLLVLVIGVVGLVPIFMVLGFAFVRGVFTRFGAGGEAELVERVLAQGVPLIAAVLVSTLIWTVAFVVYCYMQAGVLGTLAAGERAAGLPRMRWVDFRQFSARGFFAHAEELTWPVFWLVNLFLLMGTVVLLAFGVGALLVIAVAIGDGFATGAGLERLGEFGIGIAFLGCFGVIAIALFSIFLSIWMQISLAELAVGTRGVFRATRSALAIFGRRLPGLALLFLILIVASMAMAIVFMPLSLVTELVLKDRISTYLAGQAFFTLLQWLIGGIINLGWSGTIIALTAGEHGDRP